ncbi:nucleobase-ascorbate transporter 7-like isoform X2 [Vicia villosa]|uniref:nucleobase-ascorbate transporter 7-like isoform X2 n=1 Tax=Vicia villosa TaxID=3911 RepID=UPI00273C52A9|nr:nucleobase-ascorbate transporter 7-like isoform X2 [Vicia villosa]
MRLKKRKKLYSNTVPMELAKEVVVLFFSYHRFTGKLLTTTMISLINKNLSCVRRGDRRIFILDRFAVIFSFLVVWTYAHIQTLAGTYKSSHTCRTDSAGVIGGALWFTIPFPFQWGAPSFALGELYDDSFVRTRCVCFLYLSHIFGFYFALEE